MTGKIQFHEKKKRRWPGFLHLSYLAYLLLFLLFWFGVSSVGKSTIEKQEESLRTAISKDIVHCYAVEGFYPPSLDYLEEHYGLTYNKDLFFIDYQPIGSNMIPSITILRKE